MKKINIQQHIIALGAAMASIALGACDNIPGQTVVENFGDDASIGTKIVGSIEYNSEGMAYTWESGSKPREGLTDPYYDSYFGSEKIFYSAKERISATRTETILGRGVAENVSELFSEIETSDFEIEEYEEESSSDYEADIHYIADMSPRIAYNAARYFPESGFVVHRTLSGYDPIREIGGVATLYNSLEEGASWSEFAPYFGDNGALWLPDYINDNENEALYVVDGTEKLTLKKDGKDEEVEAFVVLVYESGSAGPNEYYWEYGNDAYTTGAREVSPEDCFDIAEVTENDGGASDSYYDLISINCETQPVRQTLWVYDGMVIKQEEQYTEFDFWDIDVDDQGDVTAEYILYFVKATYSVSEIKSAE